jgi:hypothetical protein
MRNLDKFSTYQGISVGIISFDRRLQFLSGHKFFIASSLRRTLVQQIIGGLLMLHLKNFFSTHIPVGNVIQVSGDGLPIL